MTRLRTPQGLFNTLLLAACLGTTAWAQAATSQPSEPDHAMAKPMAEHQARRLDKLKAALQISPQQEPAWASFAAAMQPPAINPELGMKHQAMAHMTTPERIDHMQAMQAEHAQRMRQRGEATKAFYQQLTPEQQKRFDELSLKFMRQRHHGMQHEGAH